jgi:hypothetical protein
MAATTEHPPVCETFLLIAERCAEVYGAPLPKRLLTLGNAEGWRLTLNTTVEKIDRYEPVSAYVEWNEWPAGIIDPFGGCIAAGAAANLETFLEWLKTAEQPEPTA